MTSPYPKAMVHPAYAPAVLGRAPGEGRPARFPPVTVEAKDQEEEYRAKGYLAHGETGKGIAAYAEFPKMLAHPDHVDAVSDEIIPRRENGQILTTVIRGAPEKYPPVIVNTPAEEAAWGAKGYLAPGRGDPEAIAAAIASPHVPGRVVEEWPKMVNGVLVDERPTVDTTKYPMWLSDGGRDKDGNPTGQIVNSEAEHRAARPEDFVSVPAAARPEVATPPSAPVATVDAAEHQRALSELAELRARLAEVEKPKNKGGRPRKAAAA